MLCSNNNPNNNRNWIRSYLTTTKRIRNFKTKKIRHLNSLYPTPSLQLEKAAISFVSTIIQLTPHLQHLQYNSTWSFNKLCSKIPLKLLLCHNWIHLPPTSQQFVKLQVLCSKIIPFIHNKKGPKKLCLKKIHQSNPIPLIAIIYT